MLNKPRKVKGHMPFEAWAVPVPRESVVFISEDILALKLLISIYSQKKKINPNKQKKPWENPPRIISR